MLSFSALVAATVVCRRASAALVTAGLVADYKFSRLDCEANSFPDDEPLIGPLVVDDPTTHCHRGLGVGTDGTASDAKHVSSTGDITALRAALNASVAAGSDGFTIEMWLYPQHLGAGPGLSQETILAITDPGSVASGSCDNQALRIFAGPSGDVTVEFKYFGERLGVPDTAFRCVSAVTPAGVLTTAPLHLVVAIGDSIDIYVNGAIVLNALFFEDSSRTYDKMRYTEEAEGWPTNYVLDLLSDRDSRTFNGDILGLRLYSEKLTEAEVLLNFAEKLPRSVPTVKSMNVTINEDGEDPSNPAPVEDHGGYLAPAHLVSLDLSVYDSDDQTNWPTYTGANFANVYISAVPASAAAGGEVLLPDGTVVTPGMLPVLVPRVVATGEYTVLLRPRLNAYTGDDDNFVDFKFSYYAEDGVNSAQSATTAIVTVSVDPVNDAPIGEPIVDEQIRDGQTTILDLEGTDVDDATVMTAHITTLPGAGAALYRVNGVGLVVEPRVAIEIGDTLNVTKVAYFYSDNVTTINMTTGVFGTDAFEFTLTDINGNVSAPTSVTIELKTSVVANFAINDGLYANFPQTVSEGVNSAVIVFGEDESDEKLDVCIEITALPSHGNLYFGATLLTVGAKPATNISAAGYNAGLELRYEGNANYFTAPTTRWDGSPTVETEDDFFEYLTYICSNALRYSVVASQYVRVRNVNTPALLTAKKTTFAVSAIGGNTEEGDVSVYLTGLNVTDLDGDVDGVRVILQAGKGKISIDLAERALMDFNSLKYCFGNGLLWNCRNDGDKDSIIVFVATPSDANTILGAVSYESGTADILDTVTITVLDGQGGECLAQHADDDEAGANSVRNGCFNSTLKLTVDVGEFATFGSSDPKTGTSLPWQLVIGLMGAGLFVCCGGCLCCIRHFVNIDLKPSKRRSAHKAAHGAPRHGAKKPHGRRRSSAFFDTAVGAAKSISPMVRRIATFIQKIFFFWFPGMMRRIKHGQREKRTKRQPVAGRMSIFSRLGRSKPQPPKPKKKPPVVDQPTRTPIPPTFTEFVAPDEEAPAVENPLENERI